MCSFQHVYSAGHALLRAFDDFFFSTLLAHFTHYKKCVTGKKKGYRTPREIVRGRAVPVARAKVLMHES